MRQRDWRVGIPLMIIVGLVLWLQAKVLNGDFGPNLREGSRMFWGLR